jgi:hypothetical protein
MAYSPSRQKRCLIVHALRSSSGQRQLHLALIRPRCPLRGMTYAGQLIYVLVIIQVETKAMAQDGSGRGRLVPTGKSTPSLDVNYEIFHRFLDTNLLNGLATSRKTAVVRSISCDNGQAVPLGDFDLLVDKEIIRLKHISSDPEWLVLSSYA